MLILSIVYPIAQQRNGIPNEHGTQPARPLVRLGRCIRALSRSVHWDTLYETSDLWHTAATNMHQLTGDFYTVGEILGHSLKGIGNQLGIIGGLEAVTERYVDVRLEWKRVVLETYHKAVLNKKSRDQER